MTWPLRISFSLGCAVAAIAGTVNGTVRLIDSHDPEVRKHQRFSGVAVWLDLVGRSTAGEVRRQPAVMAQKMKTFTPHVLAILAGTEVEFPNFDPIFHNAFSSYSGQVFDVGLYPPGHSRTVVFKREGVVRVFCNIHSGMSAVIVVLNTPYFAVSDSAGSFVIPNVPAGDYVLHLYHERALQKELQGLTQPLRVTAGQVSIPQLVIAETGYVQTPHQNKYGFDYPVADDQLFYSKEKK